MSNNQNELDNQYYLAVINPTEKDNFNIPYILYIPKEMQEGCTLVMEINRKETNEIKEMLEEGLDTVTKLQNCLNEFNCPILVPLMPAEEGNINFKKLNRDCFNLDKNDRYYRIDNQVLNIISKVKNDIKAVTSKNIDDRVFLSGSYESGEFAQRFALLHPNVVNTICINGGIASIPFPAKMLKYPLGSGDIKSFIGKDMDIISYYKIKFRHFGYSFENNIKFNIPADEDGFVPSIYDTCYGDSNINKETLDKYIFLYGKDMFERSNKITEHLTHIGIDAKVEIFNLESKDYLLINECVNKYIYDSYNEMNNEKGIKRIVL